jgi:uncharacterized protein with ACT and thioredoxin-like domain
MPELATILIRLSLGALSEAATRCAVCRRTPLAGERMLELDSGRVLCELCFGALPEDDRVAVRSERMTAGERPLAVVRKAA